MNMVQRKKEYVRVLTKINKRKAKYIIVIVINYLKIQHISPIHCGYIGEFIVCYVS